ncbi:MAG: serine/threonine protein kinase [Acidobacteriota bacterium]|nr:serine/threonine protein kinase [Acidobacteriota bacterium]
MAITTTKNVGEEINSRWKITKLLTSDSGQAHTYKVQDSQNESDEKEYVIKLLNKINDKTLARFEREIKASLTLEHPNIIRAVDSKYEDTSEPYLVMEYCLGGELDKKKIENLPLVKKLKMFESICEGIAHAHENKVIHRDIKPRNIFLNDQKTKTPVIGDFGICFFEEDENNDERLTALREPVGAKSFRPPEAEFGIVENVNPSFDVYSLGKLLFWFLSNGDIPVREHYNHEKFDLRNKNSEPAIHFAYEIFDKSIREAPTERYKSAIEMLGEVKELTSFVESDARYLDCKIPQSCIFCHNGKYEFIASPNREGGKFNYSKSLMFGIDFRDHEGNTLHNRQANWSQYPGLLIGHCNHCGNIQEFLMNFSLNETNMQYEPDKDWKNLPKP